MRPNDAASVSLRVVGSVQPSCGMGQARAPHDWNRAVGTYGVGAVLHAMNTGVAVIIGRALRSGRQSSEVCMRASDREHYDIHAG